MTPLVRVLLRYGVSFSSFADIVKRVYVDVAMQEFGIPGRKPTISRASVITGLSRKEILRVQRLSEIQTEGGIRQYNRAIRVVSGWARDSRFTDGKGQPRALPFEGGEASFSDLVKRYSGDVPPRAILDELERVGSVEIDERGLIQLRSVAYVPSAGETEKLEILGNDVADLIDTIDHNLRAEGDQSRFQLKVSYDNLPEEFLETFHVLSSRKSLDLLQSFDKELAGADRDTNSESQGTGRYRAGISIYYFQETVPEKESP